MAVFVDHVKQDQLRVKNDKKILSKYSTIDLDESSFAQHLEDISDEELTVQVGDQEIKVIARAVFDKINVLKAKNITYFAMETYTKGILKGL